LVELNGVGKNLQDHAAVSEDIFVEDKPRLSFSPSDLSLSNILEYITHGRGKLEYISHGRGKLEYISHFRGKL